MRKVQYLIFLSLVLFSGCKKEPEPVGPKNDYLTDREYNKLIIEIQSVSGSEPTQATLDNLLAFLNQYLNKPEGIEIRKTSIASPGKSIYTLDDIKNIEKNNRQNHTFENTLTAYILFLDGEYSGNSGNSKVLGLAYSRSSMVLFEETIKDYSGGLGQPSTTVFETTVAEHEFCHVMGLVNNGIEPSSAHQDSEHGAHCTSETCLMYWAAETSDFLNNVIGNNVPKLDEACIRDLRKAGAK